MKKSQDLAIAYSIKRKNKMAAGGEVRDQAASRPRPMPSERDNDAKMAAMNSAKKALPNDKWTDTPGLTQARSNNSPRVIPVPRPKMVPTDAFSVRLRDVEDKLEQMIPPKAMAVGGKIEDDPDHQALRHNKPTDDEYGGQDENDDALQPSGLESDNDEMGPDEEEFMSSKFAKGGSIEREEDMQPEDEEEMDHNSSIADAIMAKRRKLAQKSGSPDEDEAEMFAEGGEVDLEENRDEMPNSYYDDNEAILKENYGEDLDDMDQPKDSNEESPEHEPEDRYDMVEAIRRKMSSRRQR